MRLSVQFIENNNRLSVTFSESDTKLSVLFLENNTRLSVSFDDYQTVTKYVGGSLYDGDYEVTPTPHGKTLPTADKVLLKDVQIRAIPVYDVGNNSGGTTVYIATMDEAT